MKMNRSVLVISIILIVSTSYPLSAQEMKITRVANDKLAADAGSAAGIRMDQLYDIVKVMSYGNKIIGTARVVLVNENVSALTIVKLEPNFTVNSGDLLVLPGSTEHRSESKQIGRRNSQAKSGSAASSKRTGVRFGVGTDITGGIAYGGAINYLFPVSPNTWELGLNIFGGSFEETTEEFNTYVETTDILVIAILGNYLINYDPKKPGLFFLVGFGAGFIDVAWEEKSDTDESLGTPLPGGGSKQSEDASAAGFMLNLGLGHNFKGGLDLRAEIPVFIISSAPGESSAFIPTFMVTLGFRL